MTTSHTITTYDPETEETTEVELSKLIKTNLEEGNIDSNYLESTLTEIVNERSIDPEVFAALLGETMLELTNSGELDGNALADTIGGFGTHSWLQHEFVYGVLMPMIETLADTPTDGRNEGAINQCETMIEALQEERTTTPIDNK
jgi:hypothetical protein